MSLPIEEYIETLKRLAPTISPATLIAIESDLEAKEAEVKESRVAGPKAANQLVVVVLDPDNKMPDVGQLSALVLQVPETQDAGDTLNRLHAAVYAQRAAAKRKVAPINSVVEAAERLKRRFAKDQSITLKAKVPVRILRSDGTIPAA